MASLLKFVIRDFDLRFEGQIFESRPTHSGEITYSGATSASTVVLRVAPYPDTSLPTAANINSSVTSANSNVKRATVATEQIAS